MATLHESLKSLSPVTFDSVPSNLSELDNYLRKHFSACQLLIESVPPPPPPPASGPYSRRDRSNTASSIASGISDISQSAIRSDPPIPEHESLQKEWGKPLKLSSKENPLGIGVYKLSGKDGRGAWFARRSVHEGLSFDRWKSGLEKEFPESVEVEGGPGAGKVRGIGGEKRVERIVVDGGTMEVYHLSAQFPGPSAPRDFVTLLLTSESALGDNGPRHYMIISKPCEHSDCPQRDGFVRGQYESVEFIREIPVRPKKTLSAIDLATWSHLPSQTEEIHLEPTNQEQLTSVHNLNINSQAETDVKDQRTEAGLLSPSATEIDSNTGRPRGKTISFAESRGVSAKGESLDLHPNEGKNAEMNPVEWIMVTRSDPGGSVPRFMVERGTPSGIVTDAGKFLDWACKKSDSIKEEIALEQEEDPRVSENGDGLDNLNIPETLTHQSQEAMPNDYEAKTDTPPTGFVANLANAAYAAYDAMTYQAPQAVVDGVSTGLESSNESLRTSRSPSTSSIDSFASAEDYLSNPSVLSSNSTTRLTPYDKEAQLFQGRKIALNIKLEKAKEKEVKDKEAPTERELARIGKLEEKHAREMEKVEQRHSKAIQKLDDKKKREQKKEADRKAKMEKKEEEKRVKAEKDAPKAEMESLKAERNLLQETVRQVQAENTMLVALIGKLEGGEEALRELKADGQKTGCRASSFKGAATHVAGEEES